MTNLLLLWALASTQAFVEIEVLKGVEAVPNQVVSFQEIQGGNLLNQESKRTNSRGRVRFDIPSSETPKRFVASTLFDNETYFSPVISSESQENLNFPLQVFEARASQEGLVIKNLSIAARYLNQQLIIEESYTVENRSSYLLRGLPLPEGPSLFQIQVPEGIFRWMPLFGFAQNDFRADGNTLHISKPLQPGEHFFAYSYVVDNPHIEFELSRDFDIPIESVELSTNSQEMGFDWFGQALPTASSKFYRNEWLQLYEAPAPSSGSLQLQLTGLPWNIPWSWWLPLIGLGLFLAISFLAQSQMRGNLRQSSLNRQEFLAELNKLEFLRSQRLIDQKEYRSRKISTLQKLVPLYLSGNNDKDVASGS